MNAEQRRSELGRGGLTLVIVAALMLIGVAGVQITGEKYAILLAILPLLLGGIVGLRRPGVIWFGALAVVLAGAGMFAASGFMAGTPLPAGRNLFAMACILVWCGLCGAFGAWRAKP